MAYSSNSSNNNSIYINSSIYADALTVFDDGRIAVYNLTSNATHIPIIYNINQTYKSFLEIYGLTKALITISNGSVGCPNVETCSGNINITIPTNSFIKVYDNYYVETGTTPNEPRPNDPISHGTTGTGTNQSTIINSTLNDSVIFSLSGLNNALIYNNSLDILESSNINDNDGEINITIHGDEIIYILNNYEKSELYTRDYDPIWISESSDTVKHIASNLTNTVNVTVYLNTRDCNTLGSIEYTSGSYSMNYTKTSGFFHTGITYACSAGIVTIDNIPIMSGSSNMFTLDYNQGALTACESSVSTFISYVSLLGLIGVILFFGWMLAYILGFVNKTSFHNVNIIGGLTILILLGLLLIISIFIFSTMCSVF